MIVYFDTSAIVQLVIDEATSDLCIRLWNESARAVSVRLVYPEARAALARAARMRRLTHEQLDDAVGVLDTLMDEVDLIELGPLVARAAGDLAQRYGLRGYDAVHLAAALSVADDDVLVATGDVDLSEAARSAGLAVALVKA